MVNFLLAFVILLNGLFCLYRNRIDLILLFYLSNVLYHHGIILDYIDTGSFAAFPSVESKAIITVVFSSLLIIQIIDLTISKKISVRSVERVFRPTKQAHKMFTVFMWLSAISTLLFLYSARGELMVGKAGSKASAIPFSYLGSYYFAYACSGYFYLSQNYRIFGLTVIIILLYVFVGTRAFAVLFILNILMLATSNKTLFSKEVVKYCIIITLAFVFFALYKHFYIALKSLDLSQLVDVFAKLDVAKIMWMLFSAEWAQISMNTHKITMLENKELYNFWDSLVMAIPGFDAWSHLPERFSEVIYFHANPGYTYGLGGAFWAEIWYAHGLLGVFVVSQIILWYVLYCNTLLTNRLEMYLYHAPLVIFISFYLPRNDFTLLMGSLKNLAFSLIIGIILLKILPWKLKQRKKNYVAR